MLKSVIIPTRDRPEMTLRAVKSVYSQSNSADEVIVVDDGSTDSTGELVKENFPDITLIKTDHQGAGLARHTGVLNAKGEFLLFLDSDDVWRPDHIKILYDASIQNPAYKAFFGTVQTVNIITGESFLIPEKKIDSEDQSFHSMVRWCFTVPSSFAIKREAYLKTGGFRDEPFGEDWCFFIRLADRYNLLHCDRIITDRYLHQSSACFNVRKKDITTLLGTIERILKSSINATDADIENFNKLREVTKKECLKWKTVQDWYLSLKRHGLV